MVALKSVWQQVVEHSNQRVTTIETETQQTIDTIKQELLQVQQANNLLQQQAHQLKQERDNLVLEKSSLNHLLNDAKVELARKSQDAEILQKQLFDLQQKYEAQSKILIDGQTREAVSSHQVLQLQKELKEVRDQNQVLAHEKLVLTQEKAQLNGQLKQLLQIGK